MDSEAYTNYVGRSEQNASQNSSPHTPLGNRDKTTGYDSSDSRKRKGAVDLVRPERPDTKQGKVNPTIGVEDNPVSLVKPLLKGKHGEDRKRESVNIFSRFVNATQAWEGKADGKLDNLTKGVDDARRMVRGLTEKQVTRDDLGGAVKRIEKAVSGKGVDDEQIANMVADRLGPVLKRVAKGLEKKEDVVVAKGPDLKTVKSTNALEERVEELESKLASMEGFVKQLKPDTVQVKEEPVVRDSRDMQGGESTLIHGSRPLQLGGASMEVWMVQNDVKKLRDDLMTVNKAVGNLFWYLYGRDRKGRNLTLHGKERTDGFYAVQVYENKEKRYKRVEAVEMWRCGCGYDTSRGGR